MPFIFLQMAQFIVHDMRAVGMHHHGPKELVVGGMYNLKWEPDNVTDIGNAMAVLDMKGHTRAYLAREDAKIVSTLVYSRAIKHDMIQCIPVNTSHVVTQKLGPQHECNLMFRASSGETDFVAAILTNGHCTFEHY